jgi:hypothetical protein
LAAVATNLGRVRAIDLLASLDEFPVKKRGDATRRRRWRSPARLEQYARRRNERFAELMWSGDFARPAQATDATEFSGSSDVRREKEGFGDE